MPSEECLNREVHLKTEEKLEGWQAQTESQYLLNQSQIQKLNLQCNDIHTEEASIYHGHKAILPHQRVRRAQSSNLSSRFLMIMKKGAKLLPLCKHSIFSILQGTSTIQSHPIILAARRATGAGEHPSPAEASQRK